MNRKTFRKATLIFFLIIGSGLITSALLKNPAHKSVQKHSVSFTTDKEEDQWVSAEMAKLSMQERIAQSFMVACWSNKGKEHLDETEELVRIQKIGGLIFFQGEKDNLQETIQQMQANAKIPLLIGMDAEWGVAMRLSGEPRFPYQQTIGAANDLNLTERIGYQMGVECDMLGIHMNFSPVADVNLNPKNPVIGFRAFGSNPQQVAKHTAAMVKGIEDAGVISCVKHFPGHGDTDKDSHKELPTVSHSVSEFEAKDFLPFKSGIEAGTRSVMVAHLNVPSLDPSGTPSSLSKVVIETYLRKKLGFKGLVISDALNMKAVSDKYGKSEVVAKAYIAGCDILLFPENVEDAIKLIHSKVESGELTKEVINEHCKRVLRAKYQAIVHKPIVKRKDPAPERRLIINQIYEKALLCIKNEADNLPIDKLDKEIIRIAIGTHTSAFRDRLNDYGKITHYKYFTSEEALRRLKEIKLNPEANYILDFHSDGQRARNNYGFGTWKKVLDLLPKDANATVVLFGNPLVLQEETEFPSSVKSVLCAYENTAAAQERTAQAIMGAFDVEGKLAMDLNAYWKIGFGVQIKKNGRLKYSQPEELGLNPAKLREVDEIVAKAIEAKAFPGCQIVVAIDGKIVIQKSYGTTIYENGDSITNEHIYDIASITKIAASTTALMRLKTLGKFDEKSDLDELVSEYVKGTPYANLKAIDLLTHQAGLTPWIAFYKRTMENGNLDSSIYAKIDKGVYNRVVADNIWIRNDYWKTMLKIIVETPLTGKKSYEYSDLSYYFFNKYIELTTGMGEEEFVDKEIYKPLGLQRMTYLPLKKFSKKQIVPTEFDKDFRKQLIHGYVHDPGAAMMGGVAGHAGLFSNATDLAALMQFLLNKGQIGDQSIIKKEIVDQFTACQFCPGNRRGIGFDKPTVSIKNGPTCDLVSPSTFGHSGFTGTITWADPENKVNFVFLSNRVYPDADNWKITKMSVRTEIQRVIYEALFEARQK
ncbi:glycoside hydrolase family 3 N-terminal domain-containing protein [Fluviicola taffensis]|uniref:beta-N-acetylhexosaminidase n=1 Tax=Fluviicola taffensis (strain DSM 16823 / NCIMB 13979 / RW262) TaxID=755732 RepID=F2ID85_FLUTR|nr:glycoside hydrolase family 3 N-terminal domain-containing protein [Fluviicola taffensis]AEA45500.1 Beta-N-acetylhexosaminidase [Fluviicola taffensis DSM 16823]